MWDHGMHFLGLIPAFGPQNLTAWCHLDLLGWKKQDEKINLEAKKLIFRQTLE